MFKNSVLKASVNTKEWAKKAAIRAVKTMAQTAVAVIGTSTVVAAVDWKIVVSSLLYFLLIYLTFPPAAPGRRLKNIMLLMPGPLNTGPVDKRFRRFCIQKPP